MKKISFKIFLLSICLLNCQHSLLAQNSLPKKEISESEKNFIQKTFEDISISDQMYRSKLASNTLNEAILHRIDSVFDTEGMQAGINYKKDLNLSLPQHVKDSLWELQAAIDFRNHLTLRGLFENYGFISKDIIEEKQHVQLLTLLHPPKDWDVSTYLKEYTEVFLAEIKAKRMPAKTYATFYDNMKGKILKEPQLYGTNQVFDPATRTVLPPIIEDLEKSNQARVAIGLPALKEGEYRIAAK